MAQDKEEYVIFNSNKYEVKNDILNLSTLGITSITEIEGLSNLTGLKVLDLSYNKISEIKGL